MKEAYGLLFEIENTLRQFIERSMQTTYGIGWQTAAPTSMKYKVSTKRFDSFCYHELISMLQAYTCLSDIIPKEFITSY